jgi:3-deoxy-manno-octulosonate cytidylyltransferase (CMP-KDO synthetase)
MGSSRFPGKPLKDILGMPMLGHVYFRAKLSTSLQEVYIATCDQEVADYAASIGAKCIMTKDTHERASDRAAEAMLKIEQNGSRSELVVMIQGDEPMITPEMIDMAVEPFRTDQNIQVLNLMAPILSEEEHQDPNCPKVVVDSNNFALYFSREPIPSAKKWNGKDPRAKWKQVCIIPFTRDFLLTFNELTPTPLEIVESIDMNRVLEHGFKVKMVPEEVETYPVDTPQDLERVKEKMANDPLRTLYQQKSS